MKHFTRSLLLEYEVCASDIDLNSDWLNFLDFRDLDAYKDAVLNFRPDYLFHLGAYTDLEYCEKNIDDTYSTNTLSVENAVQIANSLQIPILFISTAGIYDGKKELYDDWDTPNPLGTYARSKYLGERYVLENANKAFVCRAGWMMVEALKKTKNLLTRLCSNLNLVRKNCMLLMIKMEHQRIQLTLQEIVRL